MVDAGRLWEECADGLGFGFVAELAGKLPEEKFALINRGHYGFTVRDVWRNLPHAGEEASGSAPLLPGEEKGFRETGVRCFRCRACYSYSAGRGQQHPYVFL